MLQARDLHPRQCRGTEQGGPLYHDTTPVRVYSHPTTLGRKARMVRIKVLTGIPIYRQLQEGERLYLEQLDQVETPPTVSAPPAKSSLSAHVELAQLEREYLPAARPAPRDRDERYLWEAEEEARRGYERLRERERGRSWAPVEERLECLQEYLQAVPAKLAERREQLDRAKAQEQLDQEQLDRDVSMYRSHARIARDRLEARRRAYKARLKSLRPKWSAQQPALYREWVAKHRPTPRE